ncbi:cyclic nucleotide-binding domain-containing protein [Methylibium sp.]|uniref:cyclic nucleotide-binding domain-containing protein n=1 Tax=Methylibium sp. TaxID=2067992 RepID=UPI0025E2EFB8|nr:cyclic nucleotide-binding domain-containing protein [Methylibium sp.]
MKPSLERPHENPTAADGGEAAPLQMSWTARAERVMAQPFAAERGRELFTAVWRADRHGMALTPIEAARLAGHFDFVLVPAAQAVIGQDEAGDYLLVVLEGRLSVDRVQGDGSRVRLAEAHAGDLLGEMSLLDAGSRFSACTTLTPCVLAVLDARRLEALMASEPRLALALLASLARRLSLRLRQVSTRLSALLAGG